MGVEVHNLTPSHGRWEQEGFRVIPHLYSNFRASLGYMRCESQSQKKQLPGEGSRRRLDQRGQEVLRKEREGL